MSQKFGPLLVAFAALLWAVDAPFRKYLTADLSSTAIVLMEHVLIAILVLVLLYKYFGEFRLLNLREWLAVIFIGLGGSALATVFFTQSFHYVNPSVAILLQKVQPFVAILMAVLILKERMSKKLVMWALIGIFGAYLVSFPQLRVGELGLSGWNLGVLYALLAAFLWGGSTVFGRMVLEKVSFQAMTALRFLSALVFLIGLNIYQGTLGEVTKASGKDWLFVFVIAVLAGFVSLFIYYLGLKNTKASIATICELAFPFAAVIVNWKFLGATLEVNQIAGGLILLGAVLGLSKANAQDSAIIS